MSASLSFVVSDASLVSSVCSPFPFPLFIYISIYKERESGLTWVFYYYFFCNYYYYYHCCWKVELERKKSFNILKLLFWIFCESMGAVDSKKKTSQQQQQKLRTTTKKTVWQTKQKGTKGCFFDFGFVFVFVFLFFYFFLQGWCGIHSGFQKIQIGKEASKRCTRKRNKARLEIEHFKISFLLKPSGSFG